MLLPLETFNGGVLPLLETTGGVVVDVETQRA